MQKEKEWVLKLQTVFPYGINNGLGDIFINEDICVLVGSKFPT